jgi:hypothetical protein
MNLEVKLLINRLGGINGMPIFLPQLLPTKSTRVSIAMFRVEE